MRGRSSSSDADALAGGIGRSLSDVRRDAVSGNAEAYERTRAARVCGVRVVGSEGDGVEEVDWKRSGNRLSVFSLD